MSLHGTWHPRIPEVIQAAGTLAGCAPFGKPSINPKTGKCLPQVRPNNAGQCALCY